MRLIIELLYHFDSIHFIKKGKILPSLLHSLTKQNQKVEKEII